jgi:hypothetical protein
MYCGFWVAHFYWGISTCIRNGGAAVLGRVVWTQRLRASIPRSALSVADSKFGPMPKGFKSPNILKHIVKHLMVWISCSLQQIQQFSYMFMNFPVNLVKQRSNSLDKRCEILSGASTSRVLQPWRWDGIHRSTARRFNADDFDLLMILDVFVE